MEKPNPDDLETASYTCEDLAKYIKETEPYAVNSISILEEAASLLQDGVDE